MSMPISIPITLQLQADALHQPKVSDHREGTSPDLLIRLLSTIAGPASTAGLLLAEGKLQQVQQQ